MARSKIVIAKKQPTAGIFWFTARESLDVLEIGAGGGQCAAADLGHRLCALELLSAGVQHAQTLAQCRPNLHVEQGDFYTFEPSKTFDLICYWDGFGIGEDSDQQRLLNRLKRWLKPNGRLLIDIYTPWYAPSTIGKS